MVVSYDHAEIQRQARRGPTLSFIKSKAAAEAVMKRVEAELKRRRVNAATVEVIEDSRHPGAWRVQVLNTPYAAARGSDLAARAYSNINTAESRAIDAALAASYGPNDLLTRWDSSMPR